MKIFVYTFILLFSIVSNAQDYRFGKVSVEDFDAFSKSTNTSDNAIVIYRSQDVKFDFRQNAGFVQLNEVHERIIILNKEGFDWATRKIRLYNRTNNNSETLENLKGYTYTLANGKVEKEKLKNDGIFEEVANKYWKYSSFTMPNVKEGCIVEFIYEIASPYSQIDDIDIQYTIPILQYDLKISTPEYFNYNKLFNPKASYRPDIKSSSKRTTILLNTKDREQRSDGVVKTTFDKSTLDYDEKVISLNASNIPALKKEPYVDNLDNYRAKLILELMEIRFPNQEVKSFASSWENVTKIIYEDDDFGNQLNKSGYYDDDLKLVIRDEKDPLVITNLIYDFVKTKVKWNGFLGYNADNGVRKAYKDGTGNIGDINLMLISMLRNNGIDANPVLISTKNNGIPLTPTRTGFNYVICKAEIDGNMLLLDASQKFSTANILPEMSINWLGRVIKEDKTSDWIQLTPNFTSKETVSLNVKLNADLSATGIVRNQYTNYKALNRRDKFENFSKDQMVQILEKDKGELEVSNLEIENMKNATQPILQTYEYVFNNAMEQIGDKLYFAPLMFLTPKENPFKEDKRTYPIDFIYPIADKYIVNIMLPEGYTVETMPESAKFEFNGNEGTFAYIGGINGTLLQFTIVLDLNKTLILPEEYENFKKFFQLIIEKQTEKVVLKKV